MQVESGNQRVRFADFEFDPVAGELYREGHRVRLQDQPRQVLAMLLERPGEVATRDQLRERLWKADTFVDFEHGLNTAIKKVRQALGDSAESPQFIETLARRGYRFVAPVLPPDAALPDTRGNGASADPLTPVAPAAEPDRRRDASRVPRWALVLALIAAGALLTWTLTRQRGLDGSAAAHQAATAQLAVMPLRVVTGPSPEDASYIGIGIADAITTRLANIRQIVLRPTWAVLRYKDPESDPARVAAALGVQHLLLGTIQPADGTYRVSVQLVRADGVAVWGRTYDQARAGLLEVQDHIAEQIVSALRVELSPPERARLHHRYTDNPAAYDLYLRGRALLVDYTEAKMKEAIVNFERALALDQSYALARAALATATAWFSVRYAYEAEALVWGQRADQEARLALDHDPSLAHAHLAIASAAGTLYGGFNWSVVLERTAAALTLDPSLDLAHVARMRAFYHLGLFAEVREEAALAKAVNPTPGIEAARLQVAADVFSGQFAVAAEQAARMIPDTDAPAVRHYLGLARYYLGDVAGAREMLASAKRGGQPDVRSQASLASIEAATGLRREARARADAIARGSYMDHHVAYSLGAAFAQLGDLDASVKWLQNAADTGFPCYPWFDRDSLLDPVRAHPGYVRLRDRLRATYEARGTAAR